MGFLKKVASSVSNVVNAVAVAPAAVTIKALDKVGLTEPVKNTLGVDLNNLSTVAQQTAKLEGSTGSESFKNAAFDSVKIGSLAAGGAGVIGGTSAAGGFLLASKAQAGGGINVGDLGSLAGIPTGFGGIDLGGLNILKPKSIAPIAESIGDWIDSSLPSAYTSAPKSNKIMIVGIGVVTLIGLIFLIRKKR